jgi:hypothetical protein
MSQMTTPLLNVNIKNVNHYYVSDDKISPQCQQARKHSINNFHFSDDKTSPQCQHEECKQLPSPQCQHEECKQLLCLR